MSDLFMLPLVGLAVPVAAALDFTPSASKTGRMRDRCCHQDCRPLLSTLHRLALDHRRSSR
jgi:hypothetical protein